MTAYYNEINPTAAQWLRNLIAGGHIAPGVVDERSIEDVTPDELREFTQCHFFAGVGVWSYALRLAGWPDNKPVWTGSCPCQPFSQAGKGAGFDDERHLWPAFFHLISERRPNVVFGEQVASKDGLAWLDLVQTDLEATGHASGAVDLCAAGVGAPHIRQRLFWVADEWMGNANGEGLEIWRSGSEFFSDTERWEVEKRSPGLSGVSGQLADAGRQRVRTQGPDETGRTSREIFQETWKQRIWADAGTSSPSAGSVGDSHRQRLEGQQLQHIEGNQNFEATRTSAAGGLPNAANSTGYGGEPRPAIRELSKGVRTLQTGALLPGPVNGFWSGADWLSCKDGKFRAVRPGSFPLVNGAPNRVGRLRAYGNAINAEAARAFIASYMEIKS